MTTRPKGGDVVQDSKSGCLFVSVHTRSKVFRPVDHLGNSDKFIRVEDDQIENLKVISKSNTPFINADNPFEQMKSAMSVYKGKNIKVQSVVVPEVSMDRSAAVLLIAVNELPVKVIAATADESLKVLFDKAAEAANKVYKEPSIVKKDERSVDVAPAPAPEARYVGMRM